MSAKGKFSDVKAVSWNDSRLNFMTIKQLKMILKNRNDNSKENCGFEFTKPMLIDYIELNHNIQLKNYDKISVKPLKIELKLRNLTVKRPKKEVIVNTLKQFDENGFVYEIETPKKKQKIIKEPINYGKFMEGYKPKLCLGWLFMKIPKFAAVGTDTARKISEYLDSNRVIITITKENIKIWERIFKAFLRFEGKNIKTHGIHNIKYTRLTNKHEYTFLKNNYCPEFERFDWGNSCEILNNARNVIKNIRNFKINNIFIDNKLYDIQIRNPCGINWDQRGTSLNEMDFPENRCYTMQYHLKKYKFTFADLKLAFYKAKSHKYDNWFELFINVKLTFEKNTLIISFKFDHGS